MENSPLAAHKKKGLDQIESLWAYENAQQTLKVEEELSANVCEPFR